RSRHFRNGAKLDARRALERATTLSTLIHQRRLILLHHAEGMTLLGESSGRKPTTLGADLSLERSPVSLLQQGKVAVKLGLSRTEPRNSRGSSGRMVHDGQIPRSAGGTRGSS